MRKKLHFKLNCDKEEAAEYLETAVHPCVEKGYAKSEEVRLYMMREQRGMRYVEYVFDGKVTDDAIDGELKTPPGDDDRPGVLKMILLAFMAFCILAAVFGAIYLFVLVIARNFWLSLYIAMPAFGGLFALAALLAFLRRRRKKQLENLKEYFGRIAAVEEKRKQAK